MGLYFSICSLIITIILTIIYFRKKKINNDETKIYGVLLVSTIAMLLFESMTGFWYKWGIATNNLIYRLLCKMVFMSYIVINTMFSKYLINICSEVKKNNKFLLFSFIIAILIALFSPLKYIVTENSIQPSGIGIISTFIYCIVFMFYQIYLCIKHRKRISHLKFTPYYIFLLLGIINFIILIFFPGNFLIGFIFFISILIMYFTIENPDMKLLKELHKAKEISDNANEEKTLFLYNMTQEIKDVTNKINDDADIILDSKDYDEIYDSARDIKSRTTTFISATNDILNMSSVNSTTIKVYNNKYNIKNILKQIINVYGNLCKNKELKFITNIDHDIPEELYGDGISLKEALTTILNNSVKYTEKGYIELNVNTIIKNDVCRLIITIEDSGIGIKSEEINNIKVSDNSLSKTNKLITVMNGAMLISSEYGIGTKIKIILDQKMEVSEDTEVKKYNDELNDIKVLAVDDSEAGLKIIEKLLKGTKINLTKATTGKECIDKIKANKYDLILLDEELSQITANELIVKLKEIRNFKTPVVLLTKDNSYEYNEEYLKQGFVGYMLKPLKKDIFINEINKYSNNN